MASWATLPKTWNLEDVQAVFNVLITFLSGMSIPVFSRRCRQHRARKDLKGKSVTLSSLLCLNTPGEVLDVIILLKSHIQQHWEILAQCLVVILLSLTTLLSGLIAKYSTRLTYIGINTETNGLLASRRHNGMADAQVDWKLTQTSLDSAGFLLYQLLDHLPDTTTLWPSRPDGWNNR